MYSPATKGYRRHVTSDPAPQPVPVEGDLFRADGTPADRPTYWHVFGGPVEGATHGATNFALITAGPVRKEPDPQVTETTITGENGETFGYLGSFQHDPSYDDLSTLKPPAFR